VEVRDGRHEKEPAIPEKAYVAPERLIHPVGAHGPTGDPRHRVWLGGARLLLRQVPYESMRRVPLVLLALPMVAATLVSPRLAEGATTTERGQKPIATAVANPEGKQSETVAHSGLPPCTAYHYYQAEIEDRGNESLPSLTGSQTFGTNCKATAVTVSSDGLSSDYTCALLSGGSVDCWGENRDGELGDGTNEGPEQCGGYIGFVCSRVPVPVTGITDATAIAAGASHTCALLSNGGVECWGEGGYGQLGDGTEAGPEQCIEGEPSPCSTKPIAVSAIINATAIAAGDLHTCALLSTGGVDCWGYSQFGQLGDGPHDYGSATPAAVRGITDATAISAGGNQTCALLATGGVDCWGYNYEGELGDGTSENSAVPVPVTGINDAKAISVGSNTCALLSTGRVDCWGSDYAGALGDGTNSGSETCKTYRGETVPCSRAPVEVNNLRDATAIAVGDGDTCALLSNRRVRCWGGNYAGNLGDGTKSGPETCKTYRGATTPCSRIPVTVNNLSNATAISGGVDTCAVLAAGGIECWGQTAFAFSALSEDAKEESDVPVPVTGLQ
jgi:alpha-tubulin suppressor-like RCC1 family protein